jgi:hypothetical protein
MDIYDPAQPDGKPKNVIRGSEPSRGSQICGYQFPGTHSYCGERKVKGLYWCQPHHDWLALDEPDGIIRMAPGNAIGTG